MIVFTIAFGEAYIDALFGRCLPSLFMAGNYRGGVIDEPLKLAVFTLERDVSLVVARAREVVASPFPKIEAIPVGGDALAKEPPAQIAAWMMQAAVKHLLEADEIFMFAVPDLIYAAGTLESAYTLHAITGKIVATFNGRVMPRLATRDYLDASRPGNMLAFFLGHLDAMWAKHLTTELNEIPGTASGHMIYCAYDRCLVFCSAPNPTLGRLTHHDAVIMARGLRVWDHEWPRALAMTNRMIVQTDLNAGFSIEPSTKLTSGAVDPDVALSLAEKRTVKFDSAPTWCFTGMV